MAGGVPDGLALPLTATLMRMRGTDASPPRCAALAGEIGVAVRCTIYASRPSPCRDFAPYAALGMGEDACDRARVRHGLAPLGGDGRTQPLYQLWHLLHAFSHLVLLG